MECSSVKCRWNISSCIKTTFQDSSQPPRTVIGFSLRLRILVTRPRISHPCPLSFENLYRYTWGEAIFDKSRPMTPQIRVNFLAKDFKINSHRYASYVCTQLEHDFRHVSTLKWKHGYFWLQCLKKYLLKQQICQPVSQSFSYYSTLLQGFVEQRDQTARTRSICRSLFVAVLVGITVCVPVSSRTCTVISRTTWNVTITKTIYETGETK